MQFLQRPSLPQSKVLCCAVSSAQPYIIQELERHALQVVQVPPDSALSAPVCCHADMVLHHMGGKRVMLSPSSGLLKAQLQDLGFDVLQAQNTLEATYPDDIALNSLFLGNTLFCHPTGCDKGLLAFYQKQGAEVVFVRQGYTRCSVCVVGQEAIITADKSIAVAAKQKGLDVLEIESGSIQLPGYDYGFLGGCCGLLAKDTLAVTGKLSLHPQGNAIRSFCMGHGVSILELSNMPLLDVGGLVPLKEDK